MEHIFLYSHCCSSHCCCHNFICILTKRRVLLAFSVAPSRTWQALLLLLLLQVVAVAYTHRVCVCVSICLCVFLTHLCCICVKNFVVYRALLSAATFVLNASLPSLSASVSVYVHIWMCVIAYYLHKYLLSTHKRQQQQLLEESHNTFANGFIKVLILRAAKKFKDKHRYRFCI